MLLKMNMPKFKITGKMRIKQRNTQLLKQYPLRVNYSSIIYYIAIKKIFSRDNETHYITVFSDIAS